MTSETLDLPTQRPDLITYLKSRRSNLAKLMGEPGPTESELHAMLEIAARVPDHRKLAPWRFVVFDGDARADFGKHLGAVFQKNNPDMPLDRVMFEADRFLRAPVVIAVISSPKDCPRGTPIWEQQLSAGAACFNLCLAAQAHGFGAQWITEWYAYDPEIQAVLGLAEAEQVAGFIYIGTPAEAPSERVRPDVESLTDRWTNTAPPID